ncbi:MAG: exodeoxyribonuclease VII large subunit [Vampirovibrionales bacterium]|nr:exodeoxyribonuclease VII large subunit [Vampirovibrionales bacterium]
MSPRNPKSKNSQTDGSQQQLDLDAASAVVEMFLGDVLAEEVNQNNRLVPDIWSVSALTAYFQSVIENDPVLGMPVVVEGELSNVKRSSRGHVYFTLKDGKASINGILWASTVSRLKFKLEDGMAVYLTGKIEIYAPSGNYSIVGKKLEPVGVGALQLAFEQIKEKLEAEGLFLDIHKKPISEFPRRIGIITSRTGAVIHDMLRVIRQKNPGVDILILPVAVQGESAFAEIATAIKRLNQIHRMNPRYKIDTLILARGGGSFEDLFCFSEEAVVRAVFESDIPIVTGIGHEPDYGLADAAADYSAATPTAAADWAVPDLRLLMREHHYRGEILLELMNDELMAAEYELDQKATRFTELVTLVLENESRSLLRTREKLTDAIARKLEQSEQRMARQSGELSALSPLDTMKRGYAITTSLKDNKVIRSVAAVSTGDTITVRLEDGTLHASVSEIELKPSI